jgi:hypothetical protein
MESPMPHKKAPPVKRDDPSMRGPRARTEGGSLRRKRGDTRVDTIEEMYHVDFGVRGDMHLDTLREKLGDDAMDKLVEKAREK